VITSRENALIKKVVKLHTAAGRKKTRQYFTEGIRSVGQALEAGAPIAEVIYSAGVFRLPGGGELMDRVFKAGLRTVEVSESLFKHISDTENPQPVMAVIDIKDRTPDDLPETQDLLLVIADAIQDPGNLGTIIRTADAAGAKAVLLLKGTADPYGPKAVRGTMGSIFSIPVIAHDNAAELFGRLKERGVRLIAASPEGGTAYWDADFRGSIAIIIGNEANGISETAREYSDLCVALPMNGRAESLNAAVACGILLYKALEQRLT
jgi:TrmH family RNA methyltransferase